MNKTKIFAAYLPQYHETEDNNRFWGKGYTDWVAVKNSKPLYSEHRQPRIPLNENYYDLSKIDNIVWQCNLARKYGVYGFNIYHYWFKDGKQALQKPAEIILENREIDINYFFTWDTNSWVRSWSAISGNSWTTEYEKNERTEKRDEKQVLIPFEYGSEADWKKHYLYLEKFFRDERYYKINGKPVFVFFGTYNNVLERMSLYWKSLAVESGFPGLYIVNQAGSLRKNQRLDAEYIYEPSFSVWSRGDAIKRIIKKYIPIREKVGLKEYSYKKAWERVYRDNKKMMSQDFIPGAFISYDDTPRRGKNARVIKAKDLEEEINIFETYFRKLYHLCNINDKDFMLITAWNEWGEGAYMEPDSVNQYRYLEIIKSIIDSSDERK